MASYSSSYKLHLSEKPSAFDVDVNRESLYVATTGGISVLDINHLSISGSPKTVIQYDQPQVIKKLVSLSKYITLLRGGAVSLWDIEHSLTPVRDPFANPSNPIVDYHITSQNENILAACSESGELMIYDMRASMVAQRVSTGSVKPYKVEHMNNCVAIHSSSLLSVMDLRYFPSLPSDTSENCTNTLDFSQSGIQQMCWCGENTIAVGGGGSITFWDSHTTEKLDMEYQLSGQAPYLFLASPSTKSLLVSSRSKDKGSQHVKISMVRVPEVSVAAVASEKQTLIELAVLKEPLIGMALGISGHLIPPLDSGLELLLLSSGSVLHAMKVLSPVQIQQAQLTPVKASTASKGSPQYRVNEVRRDVDRLSSTSDFFSIALRREVLELEEAIELGAFRGLSVASVDPYAKQVMLVMSIPDSSYASEQLEEGLTDGRGNGATKNFSLIISFPPKYPHEGLPTLTFRASHVVEGKVSELSFEDTALISEMVEVAKRFSVSTADAPIAEGAVGKSLLLDLAKCFRFRIMQVVFGRPENVVVEELLSLVSSSYPSHDLEHTDIAKEAPKSTVEVIETKAYRVPCPVTSAARFSPIGLLLTFGSPILCTPVDVLVSAKGQHPKTYADMLLILRDEDFVSDRSDAEVEELDEMEMIRNRSLSRQSWGSRPDDSEADNDDMSLEYSLESSDQDEPFLGIEKHQGNLRSRKSTDSLASEKLSKRSVVKSLKKRGRELKSPSAIKHHSPTPGKGFDSTVMISGDPTRVVIYRIESWTFVQLAHRYKLLLSEAEQIPVSASYPNMTKFNNNENLFRAKLCRYNSNVAMKHKRDLVSQIWDLCAVSFEALISHKAEMCLSCWETSSLGGPLLKELFQYLQETNDLQTSASVLAICGSNALAAGIAQSMINRILFSYAAALQSWGANVQACLILKFVPVDAYSIAFKDMNFSFDLGRVCNKVSDLVKCRHFENEPLYCSVCESPVKALSIHCPDCGHGGHLSHIKQWFAVNGDCPSGCGCICGTRFAFDDDEEQASIQSSYGSGVYSD